MNAPATPSRAITAERRPARERLLAAADELFYEGGIHTVGIERVIERAGVAKASLYDCFGSKDELIRAYLQARHEARKARIAATLARHSEPRQRLLGVFDALGELFATPSYRGCPFMRAGAESVTGSIVKAACEDARGWMRELFVDLARDAGAADPARLGRELMLVYDGAAVSAVLDGPDAAAAARRAAALLLDAATARKADKTPRTTPRRRAPR